MKIRAAALLILSVLFVLTSGKSGKREVPLNDKDSKDLIEAVVYAYSLEEELWGNESRIKSKEDVLKLFRKGFGEKAARELSDYYWVEGEDQYGGSSSMLNAGDPVFIQPDSIEVLSRKGETAEVLLKFSKSEEGPITYRAHSVRVVLKRETNVWKLYDADTRWF